MSLVTKVRCRELIEKGTEIMKKEDPSATALMPHHLRAAMEFKPGMGISSLFREYSETRSHRSSLSSVATTKLCNENSKKMNILKSVLARDSGGGGGGGKNAREEVLKNEDT